jgi:hypothetical protein
MHTGEASLAAYFAANVQKSLDDSNSLYCNVVAILCKKVSTAEIYVALAHLARKFAHMNRQIEYACN